MRNLLKRNIKSFIVSFMETFELKYFLAVAQIENVNQAALNANISAGSLSKAISRLEDELKVPLFYKSGRGIRLSPHGEILKQRAVHLLNLEEGIKMKSLGRM